jgi:DNA-binding MarR family transcriptional regulator
MSKQRTYSEVVARRKNGPLTKREEAAWRAMVRAMVVLPRVIEADLLESARLNLADYTVVALLSEAPTRCMRMSELASKADLSASGLTRVVERLAKQGLVERNRSEDDGRGQVARLTDVGHKRLADAYPDHVASVRRRVLDHFGAVDLAVLTDALNAIGAPDA